MGTPSHRHLFEDLDVNVVHDIREADFVLNTTMSGKDFKREQLLNIKEIVLKNKIKWICTSPDVSMLKGDTIVETPGNFSQELEADGAQVEK